MTLQQSYQCQDLIILAQTFEFIYFYKDPKDYQPEEQNFIQSNLEQDVNKYLLSNHSKVHDVNNCCQFKLHFIQHMRNDKKSK